MMGPTHSINYTAADEVNNLYAVVFFQNGLRPVLAAHDLAVALNSEAFGREREMRDEFRQRHFWGHLSRFAVDRHLQASLS